MTTLVLFSASILLLSPPYAYGDETLPHAHSASGNTTTPEGEGDNLSAPTSADVESQTKGEVEESNAAQGFAAQSGVGEHPTSVEGPEEAPQSQEAPNEDTPSENASSGEEPPARSDTPAQPGRTSFRAAAELSQLSASPHAPDLVPAVFAEGGAGRFKDLIQWIQWANPGDYSAGVPTASFPTASARPDGSRPDGVVIGVEGNGDGVATSKIVNTYRDIGDIGRLITTCRASDLDFALNRSGRNGSYLHATIPGNWRGDTLDNLYNIGGAKGIQNGHPGSGTVPGTGQNPNQLLIGLANGQYNMRRRDQGFAATPRFKVACTATFWSKTASGAYTNPRHFPIDGMVIADAESAGYSNRSEEWIDVETQNTVDWHVLDTIRDTQGCPTTNNAYPSRTTTDHASATFGLFQSAPAGAKKLRLVPNGRECNEGVGGPGIVMLAQNVSEATIALQGDGVQAVAVGVIMPNDFGDAPSSYGTASAFFHPNWTQPLTFDGTNLYDSIGLSQPQSPSARLGDEVDHDANPVFDDNAQLDTAEDGITNLHDLTIDTHAGGQVQRTIACTGPGMVAGWIDWNVNGTFDGQEKSDEAPCTGNSVTLTWQVPADVQRAVQGEAGGPERSYMRIRIADPNETSFGNVSPLQPTGATSTGEVEDYAVQIYIPMLELVLHVDNSEEWTDMPVAPTTWRVEAQQGNSSEPTHNIRAQGHVPLTSVVTGQFALHARGPGNRNVRGYLPDNTGWSCQESPGTVRPSGRAFEARTSGRTNSVLTLTRADRVTCTITYRPVYGELWWGKTDPLGNKLGGSEWQLEGPRVPPGTIIHDCETQACTQAPGPYVDKDARKGEFYLRDLRWGTHTITEVRAPAGYVIGENPTRQGELVPADRIAPIVNELHPPIPVPLTGGSAAQVYAIGGIAFVIASIIAAIILPRIRRRGDD